MDERRRRRVICDFSADDVQAEAVFDAILHVADLVDPGLVDVTLGPANEWCGRCDIALNGELRDLCADCEVET